MVEPVDKFGRTIFPKTFGRMHTNEAADFDPKKGEHRRQEIVSEDPLVSQRIGDKLDGDENEDVPDQGQGRSRGIGMTARTTRMEPTPPRIRASDREPMTAGLADGIKNSGCPSHE